MIINQCKARDYPRLKQLWQQCFGDEEAFIDAFFRTGFRSKNSLCVRLNGTVAAVLYWFPCSLHAGTAAYLYAVATDPEHRGKGLCTALISRTHRLLTQRGYAGIFLVPGSEGLFRFYEKLGYRTFCGVDTFTCQAAPDTQIPSTRSVFHTDGELMLRMPEARPLKIHREDNPSPLPDTVEYFTRPIAHILAGPQLRAFAATQYQCYRVEHDLLWIRCCGERIDCPDYHLDPAIAPAIVAALGAKEGSFRIPGDKPFAMYRPLNSQVLPTFFSLAMD